MRLIKGRKAWILGVVLGVAVVTLVLLVITAKKDDDFWRIAVPTYLTGIGSLALAVLNVLLLRQEAADRKALIAAQAQRDRDEALRDARKIIVLLEPSPPALVEVLNASTEPIVDVHLISDASRPDTPPGQVWTWENGNGYTASYDAVLFPGDQYGFIGRWKPGGTNPRTALPTNADRGRLQPTISWTDSRGLHWRRTGPTLPVRLAEPWTWDPDPQVVLMQ
jgi:hypothetical protein